MKEGFGNLERVCVGKYLSGSALLSAFESQSQADLLGKLVPSDETSLEVIERLVIPLWANDADLKATIQPHLT